MNKFMSLCEEFDPRNTESPKWALIDFLKSKGINVSLVKNTDMLYIDTGEKTISITVSDNEEDAEINSNIEGGTYNVEREVEKLGDKAKSGMGGFIAKRFGTAPQKAKTAIKKRQAVANKAVDIYDMNTKELESSINMAKNRKKTTPYFTR